MPLFLWKYMMGTIPIVYQFHRLNEWETTAESLIHSIIHENDNNMNIYPQYGNNLNVADFE
ncbi:hypothetical protein SAMN05216216_102171 [Lacicoccus qingdaonensis]|uniref:Uncharacterized protein n=1 Tax=Lacicoccus qingdaonensis TaxID=576118 RepID=A0A1G9B9E4_9BACL|nr:hypothetical protein SAMN05216216_102171 [Salinicoccus qingdaonensis]